VTASLPSRPRIGITAWRRPLATPLGARTDLYTLGAEYVAAVVSAGGLPLILPHGDDDEGTLDVLDGLLLSGGGDVDPRSYDAANLASKDADAAADAWEIALARGAQARGMPVLGICRGMQILAVAAGGTLHQDIAGHDGHPDMAALSADEVLAARHKVTLDPASRLARLYGGSTRTVNTIHHQAVADAGTLRVAGRDASGLVEAVEAADGSCTMGVQWHPEKLPAGEAQAEQPLFAHLVERARAYARTKLDGRS
jgi:putative glutamine amidotransferase